MARANFVAKARKDNRVALKGESYYWWKFRYGGKQYSKTRPHRSQLTQSAFYSQLWQLEDDFEASVHAVGTVEELPELIESMIGDLEALMDECQQSLEAMPESLQESSMSGELLAERIEGIEGWINELQDIDMSMEDATTEEEEEEILENIKEEILNANPGLA
jgi:chromosome segregation ATPase